MAAGEQLQLIQDAEQLKTALAGESVVLTPQIVSVTITSSADLMFLSGGLEVTEQRAPARQDGANASKFHTRRSWCAVIRTTRRLTDTSRRRE
jgi:hypothetical protein